jgi:hypothetical protein
MALYAVTFVVGAVLAFATVDVSALGSLKQDLTKGGADRSSQ